MAQLIQAAAKSGLTVTFVENQAPDLKTHAQMVDSLDETQDAFHEQLGYDAALNFGLKQYAARFFTGEVLQARNHFSALAQGTSYDWAAHTAWQQTLAARINGDKTLSETIVDKSQGQPSIILYGAGHGRHVQDLDEYLHAQRIELFPDGLTARVSWEYMHAVAPSSARRKPNASPKARPKPPTTNASTTRCRNCRHKNPPADGFTSSSPQPAP
jgi:hypothetical protein